MHPRPLEVAMQRCSRFADRRPWPRRIALIALATAAGWVLLRLWPLPPEVLAPPSSSINILDRHGTLLRDVPLQDAHGRPVSLVNLPHFVPAAFVRSEDRRFFDHPGIDPIAMLRAAWQNVVAGRIVSGASTITEQYCRMTLSLPRTLSGRIEAATCALRLERRMDKAEILERYLTRVPFGHRIRGIEAAAQGYFDKDASRLSAAEASMLAVVIRAPSFLDPMVRPDAIGSRARMVIDALHQDGALSDADHALALAIPPTPQEPRSPFLAPHATTALLQVARREPHAPAELATTLDAHLQAMAEEVLRGHLADLDRPDIENGAVVIANSHSGEILAMVGSRDFFDATADGQVNAATSPRMPGSTLKPFLFAMALERGASPSDLLADVPSTFVQTGGAAWQPDDHDGRFRGPVRLREALASSLNIPAVRLLERIGVAPFLARLRELGFSELMLGPDAYGLGLVLGDAPVRLTSLVGAYATLARGGTYRPLTLVPRAETGIRVFDEATTRLIADILADPQARGLTFGRGGTLRLPFPVAVKTGTSSDHRDSWCVGFTPDWTVGVWVGNMRGGSMGNLWGLQGAAPVLRRVMLRLHEERAGTWFAPPEQYVQQEVCPLSGGLPQAACPGRVREWHRKDAVIPACPLHVATRVDAYNGWLAGPECPMPSTRTRHTMGSGGEFGAYARGAGLDVAPTQWSPRCPSPSGETVRTNVRILSPRHGETYLIDPSVPDRARTLALRSTGSDGHPVRFTVDGRPGPICEADQPCRWLLSPGRHWFGVEGTDAPQVAIDVLGATMRP